MFANKPMMVTVLVALMVLGLALPTHGMIKCWQTSKDNETSTKQEVYSRYRPGPVVEKECPSDKQKCYNLEYQVMDQWFFELGCTNLAVMNKEMKRGRGSYMHMVCDKDWCNTAPTFLPSLAFLVTVVLIKQWVN